MPNIAFETKSVADTYTRSDSVCRFHHGDASFSDSPSAESTNSEELTPAAVWASDIDSLLHVSSNLPPVQPVDSDAQQLSSIPTTAEIQLIGDAESENGSTKPLDHETASGLLDTVTRGGCGDAAETDTVVTVVRPGRRTLWSRVKRFAGRMFCCGVPDTDRQV